jgi:hypothetical protein
MRAQFTIAAFGLAGISAAFACSSSSGTGSPGAGNASSGGTGSGAQTTSGASSGGSGTSSSGAAPGASGGSASSGGSTSSGAGSGSTSSGGTSGATSSSGASDGGGVASGDAGLLPYPAGPYCAAAGQNGAMATGCVIPNLNWMGYVDDAGDAIATSKPYVAYSLLDMYNDAHKSGKKYAMVNIAEFDCPGCQNSATEMGASTNGGASVDMAGGVMVEVLMTAGFIAAPTKDNLDSWVNKYSLSFTVMADVDSSLPTNNTLGRRDQAYIIDLTTMKILQYIDGSVVAAGNNNSGALGMAAMHTLLGK